MKKEKQASYTIERVFLGKIQTNEFVGNIIKSHSDSTNTCNKYDDRKKLKR
ncbi:MAG: hypothetical protein HDR23_08940 [Lachnospiraceae bacterium]|nr:hypothetical protein [Lachnospiraceae bacterium]MBD5456575.1 hypothetical protein [Lachnospiraceae bacterium]